MSDRWNNQTQDWEVVEETLAETLKEQVVELPPVETVVELPPVVDTLEEIDMKRIIKKEGTVVGLANGNLFADNRKM